MPEKKSPAKKSSAIKKSSAPKTSPIPKVLAPWNLTGHGYIFLYKFPKKFVEQSGNVPDFLSGTFRGGFGAVMLVDYEKSDAGPYGEFLFIPGKFKFNKKRLNNISKIYVSSIASVQNGRTNWAIPKELADFKFTKLDDNTEQITITQPAQNKKTSSKKTSAAKTNSTDTIAEFTIKSSHLHFPVSTKLMPFPLVQKQDDKLFFTNFFGKGLGKFAKINSIIINSSLFPDISLFKPLAVIKVDPFNITFPESTISNLVTL